MYLMIYLSIFFFYRNSSSTPAAVSTGSASSIFPGFDVVLSLLSVAVAMSQF